MDVGGRSFRDTEHIHAAAMNDVLGSHIEQDVTGLSVLPWFAANTENQRSSHMISL